VLVGGGFGSCQWAAFGRNRLFVLLKFAQILQQLTGFKQSLDSGAGV